MKSPVYTSPKSSPDRLHRVTGSTYLLVVLSAVTHAYWNFLLKRSGASQAVVGLSKIFEAVVFGLVLLTGVAVSPTELLNTWLLPLVGALLVLLNYVFLSAAYRAGDLSLVYPIARGAMLMFLPPLAFLTIGESLQPLGWVGIVIIVAGIASLRGNGHGLSGAAVSYALLAAFTGACYTIWDKQSIKDVVAAGLLCRLHGDRRRCLRAIAGTIDGAHPASEHMAIAMESDHASWSLKQRVLFADPHRTADGAGELCHRHPPIEHRRRRIARMAIARRASNGAEVDRNRAGGDRLRTPGPCPLRLSLGLLDVVD